VTDGRWLALGAVAAVAVAGLVRPAGSSGRPHTAYALDRARRQFDFYLKSAQRADSEEAREVWRRRASGAFRDQLDKLWSERIHEMTRDLHHIRSEDPSRALASDPYLYHFTNYEKLLGISTDGLVSHESAHGKRCAFLSTADGIDMWAGWAAYSGPHRMSRKEDAERLRQGETTRATSLRMQPIAIRVELDRLSRSDLAIDPSGARDARWNLIRNPVRALSSDPESLYAFCYAHSIPPGDLEWARLSWQPVVHRGMEIGHAWQIEGPWLPVRSPGKGSAVRTRYFLVTDVAGHLVHFDEGAPEEVVPIGKGLFSKAYATLSHPKEVYVVVRKDTDTSKHIMAELLAEGFRSPYLPRITVVGQTKKGDDVFRMPLYRTPLRKADSETAWRQYQALQRCQKAAWARRCQKAAYGTGYETICDAVECAKKDPDIPKGLLRTLEALRDRAPDWDESLNFEFAPRNLATTEKGHLILLDPLYSIDAMWKVRGWK